MSVKYIKQAQSHNAHEREKPGSPIPQRMAVSAQFVMRLCPDLAFPVLRPTRFQGLGTT